MILLKNILDELYTFAHLYQENINTDQNILTDTSIFYLLHNEDSEVISTGHVYLAHNNTDTIVNNIKKRKKIEEIDNTHKISAYIIAANIENKKYFKKLRYYWYFLADEIRKNQQFVCFKNGILSCIFDNIYNFTKENIKLLSTLFGVIYTIYFIVLIVIDIKIPLQAILTTPSNILLIVAFFIVPFLILMLMFSYFGFVLFGSASFIIYNLYGYIKSILILYDNTNIDREKHYLCYFYNFKKNYFLLSDIQLVYKILFLTIMIPSYILLLYYPIGSSINKIFSKQTLYEEKNSISLLLTSMYYASTGFPKKINYKNNTYVIVGYDSSYIYGYKFDSNDSVESMSNDQKQQLCKERKDSGSNNSKNFWSNFSIFWKYTKYEPVNTQLIDKNETLQYEPLSNLNKEIETSINKICDVNSTNKN